MNLLQKTIAKIFRLKESNWDLLGQYPLTDPDAKLYPNTFSTTAPYAMDLYEDRAATLRTQEQFSRVRNLCRQLYEVNPTANGIINGLVAFGIDTGFAVKAQDETAQEVLDDFILKNDLAAYYSEIYMRLLRDGEVFIEILPQRNATTEIRVIEPDAVRCPLGESTDGPWSFGIHIAPGSTKPDKYCIVERDLQEEIIPAIFVKHIKINTPKNVKRGIPALWSSYTDLVSAAQLRLSTCRGQKSRNRISYFIQHQTADKTEVQSLTDARTDLTKINRVQKPVDVAVAEDGVVVSIPKGCEVKTMPPSNAGEESEKVLTEHYKAIAACMNVPLWLVAGTSDDASYNSSLVQESPLVKRILREQQIMIILWKDIFTNVLDIESEKGVMIDSSLEVDAPIVAVRNLTEENNMYKVLYDAGLVSRSTWQTKIGLDPVQENDKIAEETPKLENPNPENDQKSDSGVQLREV